MILWTQADRAVKAFAIAFVVVLALAVGACSATASLPYYVVFEGDTYYGGVASDMVISADDLTPVGEATEADENVRGDTVFALEGVSPNEAVVMENNLAGAEAPYWIFFRDGLGERGVPMWETIQGLCAYLGERPREGCS